MELLTETTTKNERKHVPRHVTIGGDLGQRRDPTAICVTEAELRKTERKVVVKPGMGGDVQRSARPWPNDCTLPSAASESSARCTVRWLAPSASASAELDQDSPSGRKASTAACWPSTGCCISFATITTIPLMRGAWHARKRACARRAD